MDKSITSSRKKYSLGTDVDKEAVFDFHFLHDEDTVSYIEDYGKIMFLMRGPPNTGKATLSDMLTSKYSNAAFCCADEYFRNSFNSPVRSRDNIKASHDFCRKKCKQACEKGTSTILVQNTHMRKWEMQPYLDLAASYNYTIIMAITLYKFDVTPESLHANNTDGLDLQYFRTRLRQWEDIPPVLMGWFLCPKDTSTVLNSALEVLKELIGDGKFCRIFDVFDTEQVLHCFKAKRLLFALAAYTTDSNEMKNHYLSDAVQNSYGKCCRITILGYYVNATGMSAIVNVNEHMSSCIFEGRQKTKDYDFSDHLGTLEVNDNIFEHNKTISFEENEMSEATTSAFSEYDEEEDIKALSCTLIHLAQEDDDLYNIGKGRKEFQEALKLAGDANGLIKATCFTELENGVQVYRLDNDEWIVKAPKKVEVSSIYTGLYV